jgi:hypothetical protein
VRPGRAPTPPTRVDLADADLGGVVAVLDDRHALAHLKVDGARRAIVDLDGDRVDKAQVTAQHPGRLLVEVDVARDLHGRVNAQPDVDGRARRSEVDGAGDQKAAAVVHVDRARQQRRVVRVRDRREPEHVGLLARHRDVAQRDGGRPRGDREGVPAAVARHVDGSVGGERVVVALGPTVATPRRHGERDQPPEPGLDLTRGSLVEITGLDRDEPAAFPRSGRGHPEAAVVEPRHERGRERRHPDLGGGLVARRRPAAAERASDRAEQAARLLRQRGAAGGHRLGMWRRWLPERGRRRGAGGGRRWKPLRRHRCAVRRGAERVLGARRLLVPDDRGDRSPRGLSAVPGLALEGGIRHALVRRGRRCTRWRHRLLHRSRPRHDGARHRNAVVVAEQRLGTRRWCAVAAAHRRRLSPADALRQQLGQLGELIRRRGRELQRRAGPVLAAELRHRCADLHRRAIAVEPRDVARYPPRGRDPVLDRDAQLARSRRDQLELDDPA